MPGCQILADTVSAASCMTSLFTTEPDGDDLTHVLRLSLVPGIGPRLRQLLLERFGSAAATFAASQSDLRSVQGIGSKLATAVHRAKEEIDVAAEIEHCRRHRVNIVPLGSAGYPRALTEIVDPPGVLFVRGAIEPRDALAIAIVGSRHAT